MAVKSLSARSAVSAPRRIVMRMVTRADEASKSAVQIGLGVNKAVVYSRLVPVNNHEMSVLLSGKVKSAS